MKRTCQRCESPFSQRENRAITYNHTFTYIESDVKKFIRETYNNCVCDNCQSEINTNFYASGVNPRFVKHKNK